MATVDASWWDETVCNMMACQHPPCWETMWRIENGHPRILLRTLDSLRRQSPEYEEELPTLKIVDLPLNYSQRERIKGNKSLASLSKTISGIREARRILSNSTLNEALIPLTSVLSSEKNSFPGLNSRMESHTPHFASVNFSSWRPAEKIQVADLGEFAAHQMDFLPAYGNVVFRWIPNMRHRHLEPEKLTSRAAMSTQRMCVKELALEGILSCKDNQKVKTRKSNKVPTGGQPYLLHLKKRQQSPVNKPNPGGKDGHSKENSVRQGPPSPCQLHLAPVTPLSKEGAQTLEGGSPTPESKEKFFPSLTVQKAPSRHTFGTKVPVTEKGPRRASSQLKLPFGGLGLAMCRMPDRAEQPNRADTQILFLFFKSSFSYFLYRVQRRRRQIHLENLKKEPSAGWSDAESHDGGCCCCFSPVCRGLELTGAVGGPPSKKEEVGEVCGVQEQHSQPVCGRSRWFCSPPVKNRVQAHPVLPAPCQPEGGRPASSEGASGRQQGPLDPGSSQGARGGNPPTVPVPSRTPSASSPLPPDLREQRPPFSLDPA